MTATAHAAVGVTIAALTNNPMIGFPAAFASHVICDLTPHWDAGTHKKSLILLTLQSMADVSVSFFLTSFLLVFVFKNVDLVYGFSLAITAQLLDWLSVPYFFLKMKFPPFSWIGEFQRKTNTKLDKPWGIVTQTIVVLVLIAIALLQ